ncbi:MAG TPA: transglutaminase-like domain-containing protein, partial [Syntrophales bacterium]|nr:transglutaminase-like domain-containing protein [Syntrophales bacterium]
TIFTLIAILSSSCSVFYFEALPPPDRPLKATSLGDLAPQDWWYGIVFNGEKVGFSRVTIHPRIETQDFIIRSESHFAIRFLGFGRCVEMKAEDVVERDLTLKSFHYRQKIDDNLLEITGKKENEHLLLTIKSQGEVKESRLPAAGKLYPASAINLYPTLYGLKLGSLHKYLVFEPQTVHIYEVNQKVAAFEQAPRLGLAPSFRVETEMEGFAATTWINPSGETEMERGLGSILITYRETEEEARKYLLAASLAKKDLAYDFSLVKTDRPITCPREVSHLTVGVTGISGILTPPSGPYQEVSKAQRNGRETIIVRTKTGEMGKGSRLTENQRRLYLSSSPQIEAYHPEIQKVARDITKGSKDDRERVSRLARWVAKEITPDLVENFSALEVLKTKRGECQSHTYLYTALARALGIPTRLVGGLVYIEGQGFLYHSWAESYDEGWIPVDATFGQVPVDGTHIKLVEGPDWSSFLPLGQVVGKVGIEIVNYSCHEEGRSEK